MNPVPWYKVKRLPRLLTPCERVERASVQRLARLTLANLFRNFAGFLKRERATVLSASAIVEKTYNRKMNSWRVARKRIAIAAS